MSKALTLRNEKGIIKGFPVHFWAQSRSSYWLKHSSLIFVNCSKSITRMLNPSFACQ